MNLLSHEEILYEGQGLYSLVKVTNKGSRVNLYTGDNYLQSSYDPSHKPIGTIFDWYLAAPWFSGCFNGQLESVLIFGLGAGSQVKLFNKAYHVNKIVGVEIDPLIIELGKKYFDLNDNNLQIVQDDALSYLSFPRRRESSNHDLIILDAFKENRFEPASSSSKFLGDVKNQLTDQGVLIINRVLDDEANKDLEETLSGIFKAVYALKVINNVFYICTNSKTAPKTVEEVNMLIKTAATLNKTLNFFRSFKPSNLQIIVV